jgi:hypothetical protein
LLSNCWLFIVKDKSDDASSICSIMSQACLAIPLQCGTASRQFRKVTKNLSRRHQTDQIILSFCLALDWKPGFIKLKATAEGRLVQSRFCMVLEQELHLSSGLHTAHDFRLQPKSAYAAWWIAPHRITSNCHFMSRCCRCLASVGS